MKKSLAILLPLILSVEAAFAGPIVRTVASTGHEVSSHSEE